MSTYQVDLGSAALARRMAGVLLVSALPGFGLLPGEVTHAGHGILEIDEVAMGSLRVRKVFPAGDGDSEVLSVDGESWPVMVKGSD